MEIKKLANYLKHNEDELVEVLTMKTEADIQAERKYLNAELQRCTSRQNTVNSLYEKLYEDNAFAKAFFHFLYLKILNFKNPCVYTRICIQVDLFGKCVI